MEEKFNIPDSFSCLKAGCRPGILGREILKRSWQSFAWVQADVFFLFFLFFGKVSPGYSQMDRGDVRSLKKEFVQGSTLSREQTLVSFQLTVGADQHLNTMM